MKRTPDPHGARNAGRRGNDNTQQDEDRQHQQRSGGAGTDTGADLAEDTIIGGGDDIRPQMVAGLVRNETELGGKKEAERQCPQPRVHPAARGGAGGDLSGQA